MGLRERVALFQKVRGHEDRRVPGLAVPPDWRLPEGRTLQVSLDRDRLSDKSGHGDGIQGSGRKWTHADWIHVLSRDVEGGTAMQHGESFPADRFQTEKFARQYQIDGGEDSGTPR